MEIKRYTFGEPVILDATLKDAAGVLADPTTLTLNLENPEGVETSKTWAGADIVRVSLGVFSYTFIPDMSGRWFYRWVSTGAVATAEEHEFAVLRSRFA